MTIAIITLSREGECLARALASTLDQAEVYVYADAAGPEDANRFASVMDLAGELFGRVQGMVFIAPTGLAVRAIAPHVRHKTTDPAVVVVDVGGRWAISLLSGHEGGANDLAVRVGNVLAAEPVVTTTTQALKTLIVGVGCRRGTGADTIVQAVREALASLGADASQVRLLASVDLKADEPGLLQAARQLGTPLVLISSDEIRTAWRQDFTVRSSVQEKVDLPAVAEPSALLAGRRTRLVLPRQVLAGVTVAVAREDCMWSE